MNHPKIIYEDSDVMVLNKPAGWITNSAQTTTTQPVVQDWVRQKHRSELLSDEQYRDGIVHRLDKETSGILLVARNVMAFSDLQRQFKERVVQKTYYCLVHGNVTLIEGMIDNPVGRLPWRRDRFGVLVGGREAVTLYKTVGHYKNKKINEEYSLLEVKPKTGRTHQIRIHLKYIGHPIVGDNFYAGRKTSRKDRLWCSRQFLHAGSIIFEHPERKEKVSFTAKLPQDLEEALETLVKIN